MDDLDYEKLLAQLMRLEGRWLGPYRDDAGHLIVAADRYLEQSATDRKDMTVLEADVRRVALELEDALPAVGRLDAVRQRVVIHMAFNMGVDQLLTRQRFISAVQFRFWDAAAEEMMISGWAKQDMPGRYHPGASPPGAAPYGSDECVQEQPCRRSYVNPRDVWIRSITGRC